MLVVLPRFAEAVTVPDGELPCGAAFAAVRSATRTATLRFNMMKTAWQSLVCLAVD